MAEEETEVQEETQGGKKSSSLLLIIIIIALILVILIGALFAVLMTGSDDTNQPQQMRKERTTGGNNAAMASIVEVGPMFPLDSFTVNLLSESGRRYLKVEMNLELSGEEVAPELENKTPVVRDIVIKLLSSKSLEEISTAKGKEKLKEQIVDQINMRLRDGHINNVYFTEFVIQ